MNIADTDTFDDLLDKIEANWTHKYDITGNQVGALRDDWERARDFMPTKPVDENFYYKSKAGNYFPRLASKGIKRVTFKVAGVNRTRYVVPGRSGLFSLGSARQIFEEL